MCVCERDVYLRKTQVNRRTIVHQSCSLCSNNQIMKYILEVTKNIQFRQHKENKEKERGKM